MKKILACLAAITIAALTSPAIATTTWSEPTNLPSYVRVVKAATTTGTESAPGTGAGLDLSGLKGFSVMVETANGSNMTAGGSFQAYLLNPVTGYWARVSDASLDFASFATSRMAVSGFAVSMPYGAIAFEPNGVGTAVNIYLVGR